MALLLAPSRTRRKLALVSPTRPRLDGPPSVAFTRMTALDDRCCLDCALPSVAAVEDFGPSVGRLRPREPLTYLQCTECGSRDQAEDGQD